MCKMNIRRLSSILLVILISNVIALAQTQVRRYAVTSETDYGIIYRLPKTELDIVVTIKAEQYQKGEYFAYAQRLLNAKPSPQNQTSYSIAKLECKVIGVADLDKQYLVKFEKNSLAPCLYLKEGNVIASVNAKATAEEEAKKNIFQDQKPDQTLPSLPREYRLATTKYQRAKLLANYIYELRETQNDILMGRAEKMPSDGEAMKLILKRLKQEETRASRLFLGDTTITYKEYHFRIEPEAASMYDRMLFRFSPYWGIVGNDDLSGEPVLLNLEVIERQKALTPEDRQKLEENNGLIFNMPGIGEVRLRYQDEELLKTRVPLTQLGTIQSLNKQMFDLDEDKTTSVYFDSRTGAVTKIESK